jgi:hypothetical protein
MTSEKFLLICDALFPFAYNLKLTGHRTTSLLINDILQIVGRVFVNFFFFQFYCNELQNNFSAKIVAGNHF